MKQISFNVHHEVPFFNRHCASIVYVLQNFFPKSLLIEKLRKLNVLNITEELEVRFQKKIRLIAHPSKLIVAKIFLKKTLLKTILISICPLFLPNRL